MLATPSHSKELMSPASGSAGSLSDVPDRVFSQGLMGPGIAILLDGSDYRIYSPVDGQVTALYPTGHAIGITSKDGTEILIHIGIESFRKADLFVKHVRQGQRVRKGQELVEIRGSLAEAADKMVLMTVPGKPDADVWTAAGKLVARQSVALRLRLVPGQGS